MIKARIGEDKLTLFGLGNDVKLLKKLDYLEVGDTRYKFNNRNGRKEYVVSLYPCSKQEPEVDPFAITQDDLDELETIITELKQEQAVLEEEHSKVKKDLSSVRRKNTVANKKIKELEAKLNVEVVPEEKSIEEAPED